VVPRSPSTTERQQTPRSLARATCAVTSAASPSALSGPLGAWVTQLVEQGRVEEEQQLAAAAAAAAASAEAQGAAQEAARRAEEELHKAGSTAWIARLKSCTSVSGFRSMSSFIAFPLAIHNQKLANEFLRPNCSGDGFTLHHAKTLINPPW
jgi:hypothetical protein